MDNIELVPKLIDYFVEALKDNILYSVSHYKLQNECDGLVCSTLIDYNGLIKLIDDIASDYHLEDEIPAIIEELKKGDKYGSTDL